MKLPAGPFVAWAALYGVLSASAVSADSLALKLSRDIDVIAPKPVAVGTLVTPAAGNPAPVQLGGDARVRGALFLRADRLEGTEGRVTAEGNVELRSRRETVLADKLSYALEDQTIHGDGNVVLRRGFDWITGPQVEYKRDT